MAENTVVIKDAVKPVCNGPGLSSHPLLTGQSRFFTHLNTVFAASIFVTLELQYVILCGILLRL